MLGRRVNAQVGHLLAAQTVAGDHALNSLDHDTLGMRAFQHLPRGALLDAARVAGVPVVDLVIALVAGHLHLVGVDDDDIVTHVHMRGEGRLVLAAQDVCDDRGEAAQNDAFGIDQDPLLLDVRRSSGEGFHIEPHYPVSLDAPAVYHCGDIMYDNSLHFSTVSDERSTILSRYALTKEQFILCTIHRDSNTDNPDNLASIFRALLDIQKQSGQTIVLPLHPRTKTKLNTSSDEETYRELINNPAIVIIEPVGFLDVIALEKNASVVITDSGGLQKEAYFFQRPCIILRPQTEWVEIVENGNAILADADTEKIVTAFNVLMQTTDFSFPELYGDGNAARFICEKIITDL